MSLRSKKLRPSLVENFLFFLFKFFKNKKNIFSYEDEIKIKFENKENKFTIFNILYMNQKIVLCCFPYFRIKSKTRDLIDWDKMKTRNCGYFFLFFPFVFHFDFLLIRLMKTRNCE